MFRDNFILPLKKVLIGNMDKTLKISHPGKWYTEFDESGHCTQAVYDQSYRRLLGYETEEEYANAQETWAGNIHPSDAARVDAHLADCLQKHPEGMDYDIEYRMMTRTGYRWFHDFGSCKRREDGSVLRCDGVVFDIQDAVDKAGAYDMIQSHQRFLGAIPLSSDILTKANIGLWAFELDEGEPPRMYADEAMLALIGLTSQISPEETYHAWYDHIDEASYPLVADAVEKMTAGEHAEVQYPWHHPNGDTWMVRCGGVRNFEYTRGVRIEGTHQNITALLHFQESKLREAEEFRHLVQGFAEKYDIVNLFHFDSNTVTAIKASDHLESSDVRFEDFASPLRYYLENIVFEGDRELMRHELALETLRLKSAQTGAYTVEYRTSLPDGSLHWNELSVTLIGQSDKLIVGMKDRDTEILLRKVRESLLNNYIGLYIVNLHGNDMKILKGTGGFEQYEGKIVPWRETMQMFSAGLEGEDKVFFRDVYGNPEATRQMLRKDKDIEYFYRSPNYGGEPIWMKSEVHIVSYDQNGEPETAMVGISTVDSQQREKMQMNAMIAEQKLRLEEQQARLEEALSMAQSANRAKTTFLNNMSHDIRTPMNAIIGYTGLAAGHIDNKEQVRDYLSKISQSSEHLLSLINDVLDMSRIESGKMNIEEKPENLSDIIHTLRNMVQSDIHAKQLDFYIDAVDVNNENILCDKLRLNQVLLNVLSNAIKYTPAGGTVTLRISEKAVTDTGYASYEFRIKDTGVGMTPEFLATIYDPFTRAKSSTVSGVQGTGLGMAITKNIVDMFGGAIRIESAPGEGTEVTIQLDFKLQSEPQKPVLIPELKGLKGLVVDDDANTCLSVSDMLRDIGMRAEWCTSGKEAVIRAGESYRMGDCFKVYILDWLMPDMNGVETARRIRKVIGDSTPIIILTSYDWSDIEDEARAAGVTAFVNKPMFPSDLNRVLAKCLGATAEAKEAPSVLRDFRGKKLLLVEDNELNREIATEILEEEGFVIDTAEDGTIAVEKMTTATAGAYDLILMDIQMPIMDGYEATRRIRALGTEISKIPILAMTANAFEEDRKAALEAGMNEHIAKPIDTSKLKETLAKFL